MARSSKSSDKSKGTYGKLSTPKSKPFSRQESLASSKSDKSKSSSSRKKSKVDSSPAKKKSTSSKRDQLKARSNHHVAKYSKNSIKERIIAAAADKKPNNNEAYAKRSAKRREKKKRKNKPKPDRIEFQMNIPDSNQHHFLKPENVPWHRAERQERFRDNYVEPVGKTDQLVTPNSKMGKSSKETIQLPPEHILSTLDSEIYSFGAYVKLTPSERNARDAFLGHITDILTSQFAKKGYLSRINNQGESREEEIYVEPFGSYATLDVCTFASDVDMCLWGLVKAEEKPTHLKFVSSDSNETEDTCILDTKRSVGDCPLLTESSLLRTMDAINSAVQGGQNCELKEEDNVGDVEDDCLFVIDRVGVAMEVVEEEEGPSSNSVEANAQSAEVEVQKGADAQSTEVQVQNGADKNLKSTDAINETIKSDEQSSTVKTKSKLKNNAAKTGDFQFVIDVDGVQELGGDLNDIPGFRDKKSADVAPESTDNMPQPNRDEELKSDEKLGSDDLVAEVNRQGIGVKLSEPTPSLNDEQPVDVELPNTKAEISSIGKSNTKAIDVDRDANLSKSPKAEAEPSLIGKSHDKSINVDDDSSQDDNQSKVVVPDDDEDDNVDKLDSFYSRQTINASNGDVIHSPPRAADRKKEEVLSVDDSSEDSDMGNGTNFRSDEVLELSVTSNAVSKLADEKQLVKPVFGPTGKTRNKVISVLQCLTSHLRRSSFTNTVECRSRARVPIINCNTRTGFEGDIAIGGHNGMDTSTYAQRQVDRFISFAPIVLIMKVLMVQQGLDKPFTGGLGSYKLYVLVAHHIECHLANGGNDRPSEILISLLFRYSGTGSPHDKSTTDLESIRNVKSLIASDDGICDLEPVFRIPDVVEMFRECHERLLDRLLLAEGPGDGESSCDNLSYLSSMIDCFRLRAARETSDRRSSLLDETCRPVPRDHPGKVSVTRKVGKVFSKNEHSSEPKRSMSVRDSGPSKRRRSEPSNTQQQNRGSRGGLIPSHRPDVAAMQSIRANPEKELLLRGTKNRKNKKKQMRDEALRVFARRSI